MNLRWLNVMVLAILLVGCNKEEVMEIEPVEKAVKITEEVIEVDGLDAEAIKGRVVEGIYKNGYFDLSFSLPKDWVILTEKEMNQLIEVGESIAESADTSENNNQRESIPFFGTFKESLKEGYGINPNVIASGEKLDTPLTGEAYLMRIQEKLLALELSYNIGKIEEVRIEDRHYSRMNAKTYIGDQVLYQNYYVTMIKDYAIIIIGTYVEEEDNKIEAVIKGE